MSKLILYLRGGMGSRVLSVLSGRLFAQHLGCDFEFYWPTEFDECQCPAESLFENLSSRKEPLDPASPGFHVEDGLGQSVDVIGERLAAGETVHLPTWYFALRPKDMSKADYRTRMYEETASLKPVPEVLAQVPSVDADAIGIHIRREDHWRNQRYSPLSLFIRIMDRHRRRRPGTTFMLATDSVAIRQFLSRRYGPGLLYLEHGLHRDTPAGVQAALVEMLALAQPRRVYGCNTSCFADLSDLFAGPGRTRILVARHGSPLDYLACAHDRRHDDLMRWNQRTHSWSVSPHLKTSRLRFEGLVHQLWTAFVLSAFYQRWPFHPIRLLPYSRPGKNRAAAA